VKLADVRRLAVRRQWRIHFRLSNGSECIVSEHGVAQVPALQSVPGFNLEEELAQAEEFLLEPVPENPKESAKARSARRAELAELAAGQTAAAPAHEEE